MNLHVPYSSDSGSPVRHRTTLSSRIELSTVSLTFVIIVLALVVSLLFLAHANRTATRGYALKKLEQERNELQTKTEIWEQRVSEAKSLKTIKKSPVVEKMTIVNNPIYIRLKTDQ